MGQPHIDDEPNVGGNCDENDTAKGAVKQPVGKFNEGIASISPSAYDIRDPLNWSLSLKVGLTQTQMHDPKSE